MAMASGQMMEPSAVRPVGEAPKFVRRTGSEMLMGIFVRRTLSVPAKWTLAASVSSPAAAVVSGLSEPRLTSSVAPPSKVRSPRKSR